FAQLASSEYFVFVDFKREALEPHGEGKRKGQATEHRGSLFCHQELAIASFLDIPILALQEAGVRQLDGLLNFVQANVLPFTDRQHLPSIIADEVQRRKWDPKWKRALTLTRDHNDFDDSHTNLGLCRFFQIRANNLHKSKIAVDCYAYLEAAVDLATRKPIAV